jgi:hypothetical protein
MNWDSIEVKWSEMARRASGDGARSEPVGRTEKGLADACAESPPADAMADTAALDAVGTPDRAIA